MHYQLGKPVLLKDPNFGGEAAMAAAAGSTMDTEVASNQLILLQKIYIQNTQTLQLFTMNI
jgi:hypothetical protein